MRRPPPPKEPLRPLVGRRGVVVIALLVVASMTLTAVLLLGRGGEEGRAPTAEPAPRPPAGTFFKSGALGVTGIRPPGWLLNGGRRAVRLRSPDRTGIVAVSATPSSISPRALMTSTLAALGRSYHKAKLSPRRRAKLGGQAGIAVSGSATNSRGVRLDLLVSTANGRRRTYLLQVFVARAPTGLRLAQAQALVDSLELHD